MISDDNIEEEMRMINRLIPELNSNVKIVAKTGTLFRVASYSGYLTDKNKNEFVFCFVVNNFNCSYYNIQQYYKELFNNIGNAK